MAQRRCRRIGLVALMHVGVAGGRNAAERGFTLLETVICIAVIVLLAAFGCETLAQRPAASRSTAIAFAALVAHARALAANTPGARAADGSGATIGVVRDGADYLVTLYAYRPIAGAVEQPQAVPNLPPLRTSTAIRLIAGGVALEPPFAIFVSPWGHAAAQAGFSVGNTAALETEPGCTSASGLALAFGSGTFGATYGLSCELAQLDLRGTIDPHTALPWAPDARAPRP